MDIPYVDIFVSDLAGVGFGVLDLIAAHDRAPRIRRRAGGRP